MKPLAIDLFCGLGGWTEGLLAEGYDVVGFDIERHAYGDEFYPSQLVLQDVLTIHGKQFSGAALVVASPPCQEFSYMAMPWSKAKEKQAKIEADPIEQKRLTALFDACFRIQREAIEAAGHFIPLVVENVRGANKWVGRSRWNYGSFHLWGDVPALMPMSKAYKTKGMNWSDQTIRGQDFTRIAGKQALEGIKVPGFSFNGSGRSFQTAAIEITGVKMPSEHGRRTDPGKGARFTSDCDGMEGYDRNHQNPFGWKMPYHGSKSSARKAAAARIAKIPMPLAQHIAAYWKPDNGVQIG